MGLTTALANDLSKIDHLTEKDKEQLCSLIIDFYAAAFAGYQQNSAFNHAIEAVVFPQGGRAESSVLFQNKKYPARLAAFMNSVYGHGAELDDGNKKAAGHAGVHLIPAVFALAEKLGSQNEDVLLALAVGYEAFIRISSAAQPGLVRRGFHATGMAGTLACAAACAKLMRLDTQGIEDAMALATTMSGGLLSYGDSRPAIKPLNPGKAAENGMFSALLAREGIQGPTESLEGQNGWFHAATDDVDETMLKASDHLLLHDCYIKLYPSCRHTHCGIDAAIALHKRVDAADIDAVRVYIYPNAIRLAGLKIPKDKDETKFSIYYTLACALLNGSYGLADMDPSHLSGDVLSIIERTSLIADESLEDRSRGIRGTRVEILCKNGNRFEETVIVPKGDPERPLSRTDILDKLRLCAQGPANKAVLERLVKAVDALKEDKTFDNPTKVLGSKI